MKPLMSIIITSFNSEDYILETIDSVLNQISLKILKKSRF